MLRGNDDINHSCKAHLPKKCALRCQTTFYWLSLTAHARPNAESIHVLAESRRCFNIDKFVFFSKNLVKSWICGVDKFNSFDISLKFDGSAALLWRRLANFRMIFLHWKRAQDLVRISTFFFQIVKSRSYSPINIALSARNGPEFWHLRQFL